MTACNLIVDSILARLHPGAQAGSHLRISVADTGTGISAAILDRIFDLLFTTKAAGKGTGLGLSMVAGIVKSHGGFVHVESVVGQGATFHLYFPALSTSPPALLSSPPPQLAGGSGETILLIDDDPVVRTTLGMLLERAGYRVLTGENCASGLMAFERDRKEIKLVITDMMLPDGSGLMATGEFDELLRLVPAVECLSKPLTSRVLLGAVGRALKSVAR